jgi:hypothetical protein
MKFNSNNASLAKVLSLCLSPATMGVAMRKVKVVAWIVGVISLVVTLPGIALADVIAFSGLSTTSIEDFSTYSEGNFTVTAINGIWKSTYLVGQPSPAIYQGLSDSASFEVNRIGNGVFEFIGMDLSNFHFTTDLGPHYEIAGYLTGSPVFDSNGNVPGSGGFFFHIASPSSALIDSLLITISKPDPNINGAFTVDNISVSPSTVPETSSLIHLFTGLGAMALSVWRRKKGRGYNLSNLFLKRLL